MDQYFDTNLFDFTTNHFQAYDVELTNGLNTITLTVSDLAGNVASNVFNFTYVLPTNAPVVQLYWPQDGEKLSGSNFTVRGWVSDPTAQIAAQVIGGGLTNSVLAITERNGRFWAENLPLAAGTNLITLTATDLGTNTTVTNYAVIKGSVALLITPLHSSFLNDPFVTVSGTINVSDHKIWVNGVEVTNLSGGDWSVEGVPLNEGGTAVVQARAIPLSDNGGNGTGGSGGEGSTYENPGNPSSPGGTTEESSADKDAEVVVIHYSKGWNFTWMSRPPVSLVGNVLASTMWNEKQPGHWWVDDCYGNTFHDDFYFEWFFRVWGENGAGTECTGYDRGTKANVCGFHDYTEPEPYTVPVSWPGEYCRRVGYRVRGDSTSGYYDEFVGRTARTLYELRTGGKARIYGQKNLFVLNSHATTVGNPFWPEVDWTWEGMDGTNLPGTDVVLGSLGPLGNDERLYIFLSDGETHDVTPTVARIPYYRYDHPWFSKHVLVHQTVCTALTDPRPERRQLGVGEYVNFHFDPEVPMTFPEEPWWLAFAGSVSESSGQATVFTAPSNAAMATVRVLVRDAQLDTVFAVKEPSGASAVKAFDWPGIPLGTLGVGMRLNVTVEPANVSFSRVQILEIGGYATNVEGFFTNFPSTYHSPNPDWFTLPCDNTFPDDAGFVPDPCPPWSAGKCDYFIPLKWRMIDGDSTNDIMTVTQTLEVLGSNGTAKVTKYNRSATRTP